MRRGRDRIRTETDRQTERKRLFDPNTMCFNHDSKIRHQAILIYNSVLKCQDLTRFNKIAIQGTPQMAVD